MITVFNRRELTVTQSLDRQSEIRSILAAHNIDYQIKTRFMGRFALSSDARRMGTLGIQSDSAYQYTFFVKRRDYETARQLIGQ